MAGGGSLRTIYKGMARHRQGGGMAPHIAFATMRRMRISGPGTVFSLSMPLSTVPHGHLDRARIQS